MDHRSSGSRAESRAETWLRDRGLRLVERNYRCRAGEIDLIMLDPTAPDTEVLAFIEVRRRGAGSRVRSFDSVDPRKQARLVSAARHFLMSRPRWQEHACRFDVVGIEDDPTGLRWIPGAFEAES